MNETDEILKRNDCNTPVLSLFDLLDGVEPINRNSGNNYCACREISVHRSRESATSLKPMIYYGKQMVEKFSNSLIEQVEPWLMLVS